MAEAIKKTLIQKTPNRWRHWTRALQILDLTGQIVSWADRPLIESPPNVCSPNAAGFADQQRL